MKTQDEILELFNKAKDGTLPSDFQDWSLCDEDGWTIAHTAAYCSHLPKDFDQWDLKDDCGITVADIAGRNSILPNDF